VIVSLSCTHVPIELRSLQDAARHVEKERGRLLNHKVVSVGHFPFLQFHDYDEYAQLHLCSWNRLYNHVRQVWLPGAGEVSSHEVSGFGIG
jgi:hypothetical protein